MQRNFKRQPRIAFWLVPKRQDRENLQSLVVALAGRFSAPIFVPHVTIYSCLRSRADQELIVMSGLANHCHPMTMCTDDLVSKDRLTQTLFVKLKPATAAKELYKSLHAGVAHPSNYEFDPHLSLLYQNLSATVRESLVREVDITRDKIVFSELWAVAIPESLNSLDDLYGWQTLLTCRLDSS